MRLKQTTNGFIDLSKVQVPERPAVEDYNGPRLEYDDLVKLEPRLKNVETLAKFYSRLKSYYMFYKHIKPAFCKLVGRWCGSDKPELLTSEAYDAVYQRMLDVYEG